MSASLAALRLPDFCNLGTWLRVLLSVNGLLLAAAALEVRRLAALPGAFVELAGYVEPVTLGSLILLCAGRGWLARVPLPARIAVTIAVPAALALLFADLVAPLDVERQPLPWAALWAALVTVVLLVWFDMAARAHAPALAEARLMALTARIRPHFLFNSLNAVLGVMRSDPRRAETALEELSELFRTLMQDNRELVPLSSEIAISRQYLDLERLRLGDRLQVKWDIESCPPDALVPPLMLQPLLENAVYHGIEPLGEPGEIQVGMSQRQDRLLIEITNPCNNDGGKAHHVGNHMALANIRERLTLFFDLEASLAIEIGAGRHRVRIELPYRREGA
ncbi:MAG TPA: histidine kinase [Rhodocyclaceae bacterium]|nr:histidine kinase [Rhodocyclaceae bacterium]